MTTWTVTQATELTAPQEVRLRARRPDGTLGRPRTIWIIGDGPRVFIRSTNGPGADWYRAATATGTAQLVCGRHTYDVLLGHVADAQDLAAVDAGYRAKYGQYASIVDHLEEPGPRSATLQVLPA